MEFLKSLLNESGTRRSNMEQEIIDYVNNLYEAAPDEVKTAVSLLSYDLSSGPVYIIDNDYSTYEETSMFDTGARGLTTQEYKKLARVVYEWFNTNIETTLWYNSNDGQVSTKNPENFVEDQYEMEDWYEFDNVWSMFLGREFVSTWMR